MNEYKDYLEFAQYFGYFENDEIFFHPNRDLIFQAQKHTRNTLLFFLPEIEEKYNFKINKKIQEVLSSDVIRHNFLPKEYLMIGKSMSKQNKGKDTEYIFQKFVKGKTLCDTKDEDFNEELRKQLILLIYLILLMNLQTNLIPDTRPRYGFAQAYNWITKTDNIIVSGDDIIFIDTRWFWNTKSNLVKRGLMIPELAIQKARSEINVLLNKL